ncbi:phage tail protein [Lasius niger]|uniref:Phage tail protein n=1 Tax=Lasius niger TaxID=67767 RepID=A0A0J7N824_LASNI|nr:phage tail protein [Lasius niger]
MNKTVQSSKTDVDERSSQDEQEDNSRFYDSHIDLSDAHKSESAIQRTGTTWSGMPTRTQPPTQVTFEQAYIPATMQYPTGDTRSTGFPGPARYVESRVKLRKFKPGNNVRAWFEIADNEFLARGTFELDKFSALISSLDNEVVPGDVYALAAVADKIMEHRPTDSGQELMAIQKPGDSLLNIVTPLDIKLRRKPVFEKPRRLPADKLKVAKAEFQFMMDQEF